MTRLIQSLIIAAVLALIPLSTSSVLAAPVLAAATRTNAFSSTSTASTTVPLRDDNSTTLQFKTTAANQTVVIIYNAECEVTAARGTRLNIRILVDGKSAAPSAGTDFSLCSAVDATGGTWVSAVRQSVLKVPTAGNHVVTIAARLFGGAGTWRLDDSSVVVQLAHPAFATREGLYQSTSTNMDAFLPLKDTDVTVLNFATSAANERVKITYNAECVLAAQAPRGMDVRIFVNDATVVDGNPDRLCSAVDATGQTWAGAARQIAVTMPNAGSHAVAVHGFLDVGPGTWQINDSSLVVTRGLLASGVYDGDFANPTTTEQSVPIKASGAKALTFTTTKPNQVVKLTFNARCRISAARGNWLGIRLVVDGIEAAPASGHDFAFCASVTPGTYNYVAGFRQSVITVPSAGSHTVRVFMKISPGVIWGLDQITMIVE